jgi:hypothetical protein
MKQNFHVFLLIVLGSVLLTCCQIKKGDKTGEAVVDEISETADGIRVERNEEGMILMVDKEPFIVNGMNWDYFPIGTNYSFDFWNQPDDFIIAALAAEMTLLQEMGVNTIRVYTGIQPKWIEYIYKNYGIYTMLNHSFGRYGVSIDGNWVPHTDYANPKARTVLINEIEQLAKEFKDTPGLLFYLLGNENNYGLFWEGSETEDIPADAKNETDKAKPLYSLFNDAAKVIKEIDKNHPVAICNGDLLFIDVIKSQCPDIDIFGTNVYRGESFTDAFERVKNELDLPIIFTEFGADAFNVKDRSEDQKSQAYYLKSNWKEIYENVAGLGKAGNSLGGFTFQFSDGWWKYKQDENLDVHDENASWINEGYTLDHVEGRNNMNEEWFGICAKGPTKEDGLYELTPRKAYYVLAEVHKINPYQSGMTAETIDRYFEEIGLE